MAALRFSRRAEADLFEIGRHTIRVWGRSQAHRYLDQLEACCEKVAKNPRLGRPCDHVRPGLGRLEVAKHVIFYREEPPEGIRVIRVLHQRMLPELRLNAEGDDDPG